jgi:topoisomerase-4 subunit A
MKGRVEPQVAAEAKYKEGDRGRFELRAETTDKLLIFATNGKFYTIGCDKLPGGRGFGEPVRLWIDLANEHDIVTMMV